jgi:gamma-glutamyltranspeptidase/glutathione hydrolase
MVASAHYLATAAGADILGAGGNAVDAAVAASLALGVCEPAGSGLGGMAMMLIHHSGQDRTFVIPGPCRAPRAATPEAVERSGRYRGYRAAAVPANPSVLGYALDRYGTLKRGEVFGPAIRLAEEGFHLTELQHSLVGRYLKPLREGSAGMLFLGPDGMPLPPGRTLRQPVLARTLKRLAERGIEDFYRGETARLIAGDMARNGGFVSAGDLQDFPAQVESDPVSVAFWGGVLHTAGPPGGGIALAEMAAIFEEAADEDFDPDTPEGVVLMAEIIRRARRDRKGYRLRVGAESAGEARKLFSPRHARRAALRILERCEGEGETSHLVTADSFGNVVSMTQSIERSFGAAEIGSDLGFLYNGFMRAFKVRNKRHPHYLRPGAAARSNAAPTVVLREGRPWAALGSTGSERMCSGIFEVLVRLLRQDPFASVHAPRLHCTPEGVVQIEAGRFPSACLDALEAAGFTLERLEDSSFSMGGLQLLVREGEEWCGVGEPRRDGAAAGP